MAIHSIHHVQLAFAAGTEGQIRHFYNHLLGLPELAYPVGAGLRFAAGAQRVELLPTERWQVSGLPELRARLLDAEVALVENQALPGYLRFYVKDPAGNQLEFLEPDFEQGGHI